MRTRKKTIRNIGANYSIEGLEKELSEKYHSRRRNQKNTNQFNLLEKKTSKHSKGILKIINNPELIGIQDTFYHAKPEVEFFNKNVQKGAADIYIETKDYQYIVEFKCNDHEKNREKAKDQLPKAEKYLKITNQMNKNKPCSLLYVFGNKLITYELTKEGFQHKNTSI